MTIRLGKDVLDLVSGAMYIEPLTVYRELIQNSTDAIDVQYGQRAERVGRILITIDQENRSVTVEDNGTGIRQSISPRVLSSIGESEKRGTASRGFRGVGRLAGLGYCKKLRFESKAPQEVKKTVVEWDGIEFRKKIKDPEYKSDLSTLIEEITSIEKVPANAKKEAGFFRVSLIGVVRLPVDRLLNEEKIAEYISQICPVPFSKDFIQRSEVENFLRDNSDYKAYKVFLQRDGGNGESGEDQTPLQIFRPFNNSIGEVSITNASIETTLIETSGGVNAIWHIGHKYAGAISKSIGVRGLRARQKNIQIGEENIFAQLFKESRFNSWVSGEVHIGDPTIIPNGRRDNFEPSPSFTQLETTIHEITHSLSAKCRTDSILRTKERKLDIDLHRLVQLLDILKKSNISSEILGYLEQNISKQLSGIEQRIRSSNSLEFPGRKTKIRNLKKRLRNAIGRKEPSSGQGNGRIKSMIMGTIFHEIVTCTPDKKIAGEIIVSAIDKINKLEKQPNKHSSR